jgi:hypothetical protein
MKDQEHKSPFKSGALRQLDSDIHRMEENIASLIEERNVLEDENRQLRTEAFVKSRDEFGSMIVNGVMAAIAHPKADGMTPAAVTMLMRIRQMATIDEVHSYIDEFRKGALAELQQKELA